MIFLYAVKLLKLDDDTLIGQRRFGQNEKFDSFSSFAILKIAKHTHKLLRALTDDNNKKKQSEKEKFNEGQRHSVLIDTYKKLLFVVFDM